MAAYAVLLSLLRIIDQIPDPVLLDEEPIQSLKEKVSFLQDFLENYSQRRSSEIEDLESRITDAAYAAEDIIECYVLDQIVNGNRRYPFSDMYKEPSKSFWISPPDSYYYIRIQVEDWKNQIGDAAVDRPDPVDEIDLEGQIPDSAYGTKDIIGSTRGVAKSCSEFCRDMQIALEIMDSISKQSLIIKENQGMRDEPPNSYTPAVSSRSSLPCGGKNIMVGFDEALIRIMDDLTEQQSNRQVMTIVGMGGIGKTTLTKNVYENPFIVQHFYIRAWVTISREYSVQKILLVLLNEIGVVSDQSEHESCKNLVTFKDTFNQMTDDQLGEQLYKRLSGMRYLIVMDDIWSIEAWDKVKVFLPDNSNGSRVILTTRMSNLADHFGSCNTTEINLLDMKNSWSLLCKTVFGHERCPPELEKIGMKIAKNCRGLPLSIVVIGGLLSSSNKTRKYWEYVMENVNSIVNSSNDEHGLNILHMSYINLPIHLKPCFLYMASFPEDCEIVVSRLIRLLVSEGFLKPIHAKSLEEVAEQYLKDLIDRNLIMVHKRGSSGKVKSCKIHDLLRDLCLREAQKDNFLWVTRFHRDDFPPDIGRARRFIIHHSTWDKSCFPELNYALSSLSFSRSIICDFEWITFSDYHSPNCEAKFLRVFDVNAEYSFATILQQVNLRYLAIMINLRVDPSVPSSLYLLTNLQTLVVDDIEGKKLFYLPSIIWEMTQLRHVKFKNVIMPDPPSTLPKRNKILVLENLQTLSMLKNFRCAKKTLGRIPNLKKLGISYDYVSEDVGSTSNYLNNLIRPHKLKSLENLYHLKKLESLSLASNKLFMGNLAFPCSLKKLILKGCRIPWKDMTLIGSLPNLEVLKLLYYATEGLVWSSIEGQFCRLKYLMIEVSDLVQWTADNTHFPMLEHLILRCIDLEEIPWGIGEIQTLQLIRLDYCPISAVESAKLILEERESYGNDGLKVQVRLVTNQQILACKNFEVRVDY